MMTDEMIKSLRAAGMEIGAHTKSHPILSRLTDGTLFVCKRPDADIPGDGIARVSMQEFDGPHPAGLAGTHIHFVDPVSDQKTVWSINYQDVIAIGRLFTTGRLYLERVVSLAGPAVKNPRLIRTRIGAAIDELVAGELNRDDVRVISGSVLSGRQAVGGHAFLGRPHLQISAIADQALKISVMSGGVLRRVAGLIHLFLASQVHR